MLFNSCAQFLFIHQLQVGWNTLRVKRSITVERHHSVQLGYIIAQLAFICGVHQIQEAGSFWDFKNNTLFRFHCILLQTFLTLVSNPSFNFSGMHCHLMWWVLVSLSLWRSNKVLLTLSVVRCKLTLVPIQTLIPHLIKSHPILFYTSSVKSDTQSKLTLYYNTISCTHVGV